MRILKWHTPLEGIKSGMFHVESEHKKAVYLGPIYTLQLGEIVTERVDFSETCDIADAGHYNVRKAPRGEE